MPRTMLTPQGHRTDCIYYSIPSSAISMDIAFHAHPTSSTSMLSIDALHSVPMLAHICAQTQRYVFCGLYVYVCSMSDKRKRSFSRSKRLDSNQNFLCIGG